MIGRRVASLLFVLLVAAHAHGRELHRLDFGWKFHFGDAASPVNDFGFGSEHADFAKAGVGPAPARLDFDDRDWRTVNLPHDWAVELPFVNSDKSTVKNHGFKPVGRLFPQTSIGWYRRTFSLTPGEAGKRIVVQFDGVFRDSIVWVNGYFLGRHRAATPDSHTTSPLTFGSTNRTSLQSVSTQATMKAGSTKEPAFTDTSGSSPIHHYTFCSMACLSERSPPL